MKLDELLERKRLLAADMLNGSGDLRQAEFDVSEVAPPDVEIREAELLTMDDVCRMSPIYFEAFSAVLWVHRGFPIVSLTPTTGDMGVDVVAIRSDDGDLLQCKTTSQEGARLGWEAIKDVVMARLPIARNFQEFDLIKFAYKSIL